MWCTWRREGLRGAGGGAAPCPLLQPPVACNEWAEHGDQGRWRAGGPGWSQAVWRRPGGVADGEAGRRCARCASCVQDCSPHPGILLGKYFWPCCGTMLPGGCPFTPKIFFGSTRGHNEHRGRIDRGRRSAASAHAVAATPRRALSQAQCCRLQQPKEGAWLMGPAAGAVKFKHCRLGRRRRLGRWLLQLQLSAAADAAAAPAAPAAGSYGSCHVVPRGWAQAPCHAAARTACPDLHQRGWRVPQAGGGCRTCRFSIGL